MMGVHGRQVRHLLLGDVEPDTVVEAGHGVDWDSYFLVTPQVVPLLEEHGGHVVVVTVDAERVDLPDVPVAGMDVIAAPHLHLALRDDVDGFYLREPRDDIAVHDRLGRAVVARVRDHLCRAVLVVAEGAWHELRLFAGAALLALRPGAAEA